MSLVPHRLGVAKSAQGMTTMVTAVLGFLAAVALVIGCLGLQVLWPAAIAGAVGVIVMLGLHLAAWRGVVGRDHLASWPRTAGRIYLLAVVWGAVVGAGVVTIGVAAGQDSPGAPGPAMIAVALSVLVVLLAIAIAIHVTGARGRTIRASRLRPDATVVPGLMHRVRPTTIRSLDVGEIAYVDPSGAQRFVVEHVTWGLGDPIGGVVLLDADRPERPLRWAQAFLQDA